MSIHMFNADNDMSNTEQRKQGDSTSIGQGSLGMGGQPSDDPRDSNSSGGFKPDDDRGGGTGPIPGAHGQAKGDVSGGNVEGVTGDRAEDEDIKQAVEKGR